MVSVSPVGDNPEFHRETNDIALETESSAEFSYADFVTFIMGEEEFGRYYFCPCLSCLYYKNTLV